MKNPKEEKPKARLKILSAKALNKNCIQIKFDAQNLSIKQQDLYLDVDVKIRKASVDASTMCLESSDLDHRRNYFVQDKRRGRMPVDMSLLLDKISSDKPLGFSVEENKAVFRLFAPRATTAKLVIFERHTDSRGQEYDMVEARGGVWEFALKGSYWGKYYGYKVSGPEDPTEIFQPQQVIADPYSKAVSTRNSYLHEARSIILKTVDYDWEGDSFVSIPWEDLIIYEMHVRDMTVHHSSSIEKKGSYQGLVERGARGGINHILDLGVNAVELLPCQEFGNMEIPFNRRVNGKVNTWNPYERNHWGYMTSYFFAPESYYASGGTMKPGEYCGVYGQQVKEFKDMVKAFHQEGIAVIMDVVYNHVSHYDWNPLKYIDKKYYFRLDPKMDFLSKSGCGNDFKTESPMARRLIVDSVKYWMQEYHVDGFRFDLATMIDWETVERITDEVKKINPDVILIAEPWGGGKYDLAGFSQKGWGSWNDLFRNGVKGQNPNIGLGWIFGKAWGADNGESIKFYIRGSVKNYGGPFATKSHAINYLESHDDYTLGDFIRIASGHLKKDENIENHTINAKLTPEQMKLNKLAALFLLTSQGAVMIGEGQEFARSKVIAPTDAQDSCVGQIDHNSYNKDNETNWLNFEHKELNKELFDYYQGLIELRKAHPAFRRTPSEKIEFLHSSANFAIGYLLPRQSCGDSRNFVVLLNSDPNEPAQFTLPDGCWLKVTDANRAGTREFGEQCTGEISIPPSSGMILAD